MKYCNVYHPPSIREIVNVFFFTYVQTILILIKVIQIFQNNEIEQTKKMLDCTGSLRVHI